MAEIRATIFIKGEHGSKQHLQDCIFEPAEWEQLKKDWIAYLQTGGPPGGAYAYHAVNMDGHRGEARELLLRFEDVLAAR